MSLAKPKGKKWRLKSSYSRLAKRGVTNRTSTPTVPRVEKQKLTLGHSPDPDDAFMFYGLAKGLVDDGGYDFEHILQDIQTLNERASRGELDISAISIHAYAHLSLIHI